MTSSAQKPATPPQAPARLYLLMTSTNHRSSKIATDKPVFFTTEKIFPNIKKNKRMNK
jgi:hypothetical protein